MWVQLLEKAWAKICGSYARIIGGLTEEALRVLTGAPVKNFDHLKINVNKLWNLLDKFD